jgi:hypothetical protein
VVTDGRMKIVTIHQPNYLPWLGLFSKIALTDCFIIVNDVQYTSNSVINRNKIRTKEGWIYLTVPVGKSHTSQKIRDVLLHGDRGWMKKHWKAIKQNYSRAAFFAQYQNFFEELYQKDFKYLWQLNVEITSYLLRCFKIDVEVITTSSMQLEGLHKTDLLIKVLKNVGANVYLSGPSGRNYLDFEKFPKNNIDLKFFQFKHPVYQQAYPGFEPAMAAIDMLFNLGPQASEIIKVSGKIVTPGLSALQKGIKTGI